MKMCKGDSRSFQALLMMLLLTLSGPGARLSLRVLTARLMLISLQVSLANESASVSIVLVEGEMVEGETEELGRCMAVEEGVLE